MGGLLQQRCRIYIRCVHCMDMEGHGSSQSGVVQHPHCIRSRCRGITRQGDSGNACYGHWLNESSSTCTDSICCTTSADSSCATIYYSSDDQLPLHLLEIMMLYSFRGTPCL